MADKTFRQTVEEIQSARMCISKHCPQLKDASITCGNCRVDRICEAIGKAAEGMQPMVLEAEVDYLAGYTDCWNDCQDYWRKQVE